MRCASSGCTAEGRRTFGPVRQDESGPNGSAPPIPADDVAVCARDPGALVAAIAAATSAA
ncbi:MAG: hypothetical protein BGP03_21515 [Pseudonocardia sp. 73-21]|nr:MAG: hypothetical protein BGP03_21515 [Pseudonocardia sp. 73-21]